MQSGRTSPALFSCFLEDRDEESDYVVKLKGGGELGTTGLVCEAIAAELASWFGIRHPAHALIELDIELAQLVAASEPGKEALIRNSVGMNFGTQAQNNLVTWPIDRSPSASQFESAAEIFAFDALIQNPDRRFNNPNLGTVGDSLTIFDHELAFSFRYDIFRNSEPWDLSRQDFWSMHVFFTALRHKVLPLDNFTERLGQLPSSLLDDIEAQLPDEWDLDVFPAIRAHLMLLSSRAREFENQLRGRLV